MATPTPKPADPKRSPQRAAAELAKKKAEINKPAKGSVKFDKYKSGNFNGFRMNGPKG